MSQEKGWCKQARVARPQSRLSLRRVANERNRRWPLDRVSRTSRLLFFCAVLAALTVVLPATTASARTLSAEPSGGGFVENPDHTWTLYDYGHVIKVYSAAEKETIDRVWHAEEYDLIPGRAAGREEAGISEAEAEAAAGLVNRLRTGKPYTTTGEREVGEGYMRTLEEKRIIYKRAEALIGSLYGKTISAGGPYAVAVTIGPSMERMFTLPSWSPATLTLIGEKEHGEYGGMPEKYYWDWSSQFKVISSLVPCTSISYASGVEAGDDCAYAGQPVNLIHEWWEPIKKNGHRIVTTMKPVATRPLNISCP